MEQDNSDFFHQVLPKFFEMWSGGISGGGLNWNSLMIDIFGGPFTPDIFSFAKDVGDFFYSEYRDHDNGIDFDKDDLIAKGGLRFERGDFDEDLKELYFNGNVVDFNFAFGVNNGLSGVEVQFNVGRYSKNGGLRLYFRIGTLEYLKYHCPDADWDNWSQWD